MPPEWMWHLEEELIEWFNRLKAEREDGEAPDDDEDEDRPRRRKPDQAVPTERNAFAVGRGRDS